MYDVCDKFKRAFTHGKSASHVGNELWLHPLARHEVSKIPRSASSGKVNVDKSQDHVRHARVTIMSRFMVGHQGSKFGHQWAPQTIFISALGAAVFFDCDANEQLSCQFCGNWIRVACFTNWIGFLFMMSFVQSQDSYRPIVAGSKSSFLAFPKLDVFDIQRFFTCVIQIQCSMHLYLSLKHEIGNEVKRPSETAMLGRW